MRGWNWAPSGTRRREARATIAVYAAPRARWGQTRAGVIAVVGGEASAAGEKHLEGARKNLVAAVVDDDGAGIGGAHGIGHGRERPLA